MGINCSACCRLCKWVPGSKTVFDADDDAEADAQEEEQLNSDKPHFYVSRGNC